MRNELNNSAYFDNLDRDNPFGNRTNINNSSTITSSDNPFADGSNSTSSQNKSSSKDSPLNNPFSGNDSTVNSPISGNPIPIIKVIGVGGGGTNAIKNLAGNFNDIEIIEANTDLQVLVKSNIKNQIRLGEKLTRGCGAGGEPSVGYSAAEEASDEIKKVLRGTDMIFVTAGMGGGTGTGAAPYISRISKELGILTIGVVTTPFEFEGNRRMENAKKGIAEMEKYVDTLIVIHNQNLFRIADENMTLQTAFSLVNDVLIAGLKGMFSLICKTGHINVDISDVHSILRGEGKRGVIGVGEATGDSRAIIAAETAITNPLIDHSIKGAKGVLINISGGENMSLQEVNNAAERIRYSIGDHTDVNIIFGASYEDFDSIRVTVIATGIDSKQQNENLSGSIDNPINSRYLDSASTQGIENISSIGQIPSGNRPNIDNKNNIYPSRAYSSYNNNSGIMRDNRYTNMNSTLNNKENITKNTEYSNKDFTNYKKDNIPSYVRRSNYEKPTSSQNQ